MDDPIKRIVKTGIVLIIVAFMFAGIAYFAYRPASMPASIDEARDGAVNTVIDFTGVKTRLDEEIHTKAIVIAERVGMPPESITEFADALAIPEWKVATLPATAVETGTYNINSEALSAKLTTYNDPEYVTLALPPFNIPVTMKVPPSAQPYLMFSGLLEFVK